MEFTTHSTDAEMLTPATPAVASLATPAPSLQAESLHEEIEYQHLWRCFPDYVWSQRVRDTPSWVWGFGYDVEDSSGKAVAGGSVSTASRTRIPSPEASRRREFRMRMPIYSRAMEYAPLRKRRNQPLRRKQRSGRPKKRAIAEVMKLDTTLLREQDIANSLVKGFDRKHFQRLLLEWIIEENHSFSVCEQGRLRQIFEYSTHLSRSLMPTSPKQRSVAKFSPPTKRTRIRSSPC